jgi:polyferredoxin
MHAMPAATGWTQAVGHWLHRHQRAIRRLQWVIVGAYIVLVAVPAFLPLPQGAVHIWNNLTLFAQFVFWGIWWPFVLLSMVVVGRAWCGLFCPEGALSEIVSRRGRGLAIPHWMKWAGWPFVAFACTTVYGQMVSVYQYPKPVLVILGGSTLGAIAVGYLYGRNKRVWCRYLCPVNGVFGLLSKLAPFHFRVDRKAWEASQAGVGEPPEAFNCAPLVPVRVMRGGADCHMCGRCSGFRGAITLSRRSPNDEIVNVAGERPDPWQSALILFGLMGIAFGAFHWTGSPWYVWLKQTAAEYLVNHDILWPLESLMPWWILTDYPANNDVMTLLDGAVLLAYIATAALIVGGLASLLVALATRAVGRWSWARFHHLTQSLVPLAGCGVFLGLSALTVTLLRAEGFDLPWVGFVRAALLTGATLWCVWLAWRIAGRSVHGLARAGATLAVAAAALVGSASWTLLFWG